MPLARAVNFQSEMRILGCPYSGWRLDYVIVCVISYASQHGGVTLWVFWAANTRKTTPDGLMGLLGGALIGRSMGSNPMMMWGYRL